MAKNIGHNTLRTGNYCCFGHWYDFWLAAYVFYRSFTKKSLTAGNCTIMKKIFCCTQPSIVGSCIYHTIGNWNYMYLDVRLCKATWVWDGSGSTVDRTPDSWLAITGSTPSHDITWLFLREVTVFGRQTILGYNHHAGQLSFASSKVTKSSTRFGCGKVTKVK